MAQALVLTRQDGSTQKVNIGSPYLAIVFEDEFHRAPEGAYDNGWLAFYDAHDRPPTERAEVMEWLRQFIATDVVDLVPDPTVAVPNGQTPQPSLPS